MARYGDPGAVEWVESGGGPLIVVPESVLSAWAGGDGDDYDRACAVDGYAGLVSVGQSHALVLGDEPASTAFLPDRGAFVRWGAADSEHELLGSIDAALGTAVWEETLVWNVPGPMALFDSAWPGDEMEPENHVRLETAAGRYLVRAAQVMPVPETTFCLVQLVPLT